MNHCLTLLALLAITSTCLATADSGAQAGAPDTQQTLQRFTQVWAQDPMYLPGTFGVQVGDEQRWTVVATAGNEASGPAVTLEPGFPNEPVWYFVLDNAQTLGRLDRGELAPGTASAKAFSTDFAPMDVDFTEGFQPDGAFVGNMLQTLFHFWNRSTPEITEFSPDHTRRSHGTNLTVLHYQPGLRSAWFHVKPGDHVNENEGSRSNPFPTLIIATQGKGTARLDGVDHELKAGQSLYIPAGVDHEFLNNSGAPMEGIILMFGEGA